MIMIGVILLALNVMFVVIDVKNERIRKGTLLNAFAAGVIMMSILNVMNAQ
jgi:hypothetical protein